MYTLYIHDLHLRYARYQLKHNVIAYNTESKTDVQF